MASSRALTLFALSRRSLPSSLNCSRFQPATTLLAHQQLPRISPLHRNQFNLPRSYATMAPLAAGDSFPAGVVFSHIPWSEEKGDIKSCGMPVSYEASSLWADKKVVLVSVPGAFTPTCSASHLPGFLAKLSELKAKGADIVAFLAYNDAFVMSAWGKANGVTGEDVLFLSDPEAKFSKDSAWTLGDRTGRYAMIIDHGKVTYAENEPGREVTVSGADAVLSKL